MTLRGPDLDAEQVQPSWFKARVNSDGGVALTGDLDIASLDALRAALDQALLEPGALISIDATDLTFIDAEAIRELRRYQVAANTRRRMLYLEQVSVPVAEALDLLDMGHLLMAPQD